MLATGAIERHIAFANNDLPGIMTAASGRHYANRYAVLTGQTIVVSGNNDSIYQTVFELKNCGANVTVLDARATIEESIKEKLEKHTIELRLNTLATNAYGGKQLRSIQFGTLNNGGIWDINGQLDCDSLLVSGGWSPVVNLMSHRGIRPEWNNHNACFIIPNSQQGIHIIGSAAGCWQTQDCLASASMTIEKVTNHFHSTGNPKTSLAKIGGWTTPIEPIYEIKLNDNSKAFVDFQHDVTCNDVRLAHHEGFVSVEHLKRYTTLGMATDGGKMGNVIGLALMAEALEKDISAVGTTVFRPPLHPGGYWCFIRPSSR